MDNETPDDKRRALLVSTMAHRDETHFSPNERAELVWEAIQEAGLDFERYDLLCFCAELVGRLSLVLDDEAFKLAAKATLRRLYTIHYSAPDSFFGQPDKGGQLKDALQPQQDSSPEGSTLSRGVVEGEEDTEMGDDSPGGDS